MKRVTVAIPDSSGAYKDAQNNRYSLQSGMYSTDDVASMSRVWSPQIGESEIVLGEQANPGYSVGVCYWNIDQAVRWLGLSDT